MNVVITDVADSVGWIILNRPEALNAVTIELGAELDRAIRDLGARDDVTVIVVRGAGHNFSAGGDFGEVEQLRVGGAEALRPLFENFGRACSAVDEIELPVVAVVEGVAMAGGFEFCQAADIVLVHEDARLCDNHINFGQVPGGGGSQRLARLIGRSRALGHMLSGQPLTGRDAVDLGLAFRAWPSESFEDEVEQFISTLASRHRDAVLTIKRLVRGGLQTSLEEGLATELEAVLAHISGDAGASGVATFSKGGSV